MLDKQEIIRRLNQYLPLLKQKYPLNSIALFGSYARGEQQPGSDIDILVDFNQPVGMEIVDLAMELESILERHIDIVTYNAIKDRLFYHIKDELAYAQAYDSLLSSRRDLVALD